MIVPVALSAGNLLKHASRFCFNGRLHTCMVLRSALAGVLFVGCWVVCVVLGFRVPVCVCVALRAAPVLIRLAFAVDSACQGELSMLPLLAQRVHSRERG